jgi:tetratricopeptide (TPR) repeat protein
LGILLALLGAGLAFQGWAYLNYRGAQRDLADGNLVGAQLHLARCLKVWFWGAETHLLAAQAERKAGDLDQAADHLRKSRAFGGRGDAIELEWQLLAVQQGRLAAVKPFLIERMAQDGADTPMIAEVLVPAFIQNYELDNAMHCLERWLEHEPKRIEACRYRAQLCTLLGNDAEAVESYQQLVALEPEDDTARLRLAELLARQHRPQDALKEFELLQSRQGETPAVLCGRAACLRELNRPDEARALLERVLGQELRNDLALTERARLALDVESAAEAEKWLRRSLAERPTDPDLLSSLLHCLRKQGKANEAKDVEGTLQKVERELDRLQAITRQLAINPHNADLRYEAGQILLRNGHAAEGLRWLASALQEDPTHLPTRQALATYARNGDDKGQAGMVQLPGSRPGTGNSHSPP